MWRAARWVCFVAIAWVVFPGEQAKAASCPATVASDCAEVERILSGMTYCPASELQDAVGCFLDIVEDCHVSFQEANRFGGLHRYHHVCALDAGLGVDSPVASQARLLAFGGRCDGEVAQVLQDLGNLFEGLATVGVDTSELTASEGDLVYFTSLVVDRLLHDATYCDLDSSPELRQSLVDHLPLLERLAGLLPAESGIARRLRPSIQSLRQVQGTRSLRAAGTVRRVRVLLVDSRDDEAAGLLRVLLEDAAPWDMSRAFAMGTLAVDAILLQLYSQDRPEPEAALRLALATVARWEEPGQVPVHVSAALQLTLGEVLRGWTTGGRTMRELPAPYAAWLELLRRGLPVASGFPRLEDSAIAGIEHVSVPPPSVLFSMGLLLHPRQDFPLWAQVEQMVPYLRLAQQRPELVEHVRASVVPHLAAVLELMSHPDRAEVRRWAEVPVVPATAFRLSPHALLQSASTDGMGVDEARVALRRHRNALRLRILLEGEEGPHSGLMEQLERAAGDP